MSYCWRFDATESIEFTITYYVKNIGTETARDFYVTDTGPLGVNTRLIPALTPGSAQQLLSVSTFPRDQGFPFYVTIVADDGDRVSECNEANNTRSITVEYGDVCR